MFTHPLLLRKLNMAADHLRRAGETGWARRMVYAGDSIRKLGWTVEGKESLQRLFEATPDGQPSLDSLTFGVEHERRLGGPQGAAAANARLAELRHEIKELSAQPLRAAPAPDQPRPRSPDLP